MVAILMISAELATLGFHKIKVFWNKGYEFMISVHDLANKMLSCDSNYIVQVSCDQGLVTLAFLWVYECSYHKLSLIRIWPGKAFYLKNALVWSSIIWDWH